MDVMKAQFPWLARSLADRCEVVLSMRLADDLRAIGEYLAGHGVTVGRAGVHAGYSETAMMLAHAPHLVRMEAAEPGLSDDEFYAPDQVQRSQLSSFLYGIRSQSTNGVLGDPTGAEAQVGEHLLQMVAESLARDVTGPAVVQPAGQVVAQAT
jgi:creatinine amidohydrolase/Fe(II)-dependent formamide hydrolase-like protein